MTILIIFNLTYITRGIFDHVFAAKEGIANYTLQDALLLIYGAYLDLIPIVLVLIIHSRNFKTIKFDVPTNHQSNELDTSSPTNVI